MAFQRYVEATPLTSHTYAVNLDREWCIGSVPNGGFVTATIASAVDQHFRTTLSHLGQPDTMSMQLQFLRRTQAGPGVVTVRHVKLGNAISVVEATLSQSQDDGKNNNNNNNNNSSSSDKVQGYITHMNFSNESGLSIPPEPHCGLLPPPLPVDFSALENTGRDTHWHVQRDSGPGSPYSDFRKGMQHLVFAKPNVTQTAGFADQWVEFRPGGKEHPTVDFPTEAIGYVVDMFPLAFRDSPGMSPEERRKPRWYPTVLLNLEVKRRIPAGNRWLFVRARTAEVSNGRFDIEIVVLDQEQKLVALSNHVSLVLGVERNMAGRRGQAAQKGSRSKKAIESGKL